MFEETKRLLQRAQDTNSTLGELSDQRGDAPRVGYRILTAAVALACIGALVIAAILATR